ncbi:hypothetical protein F0L74_13840 [Chitinophaga agrisoli]|uniref:Uncharacterized protein n=1 Tax=Chitinophaga agrisoli TaxID=2607653 RepID=A0A5B2VY55_9BACT|nr:hypothetical protein [Chitinophaga agrisoli]KAA2243568.1 hypothetical protein F0L74_13840 [Chitinophaga agrisoli]
MKKQTQKKLHLGKIVVASLSKSRQSNLYGAGSGTLPCSFCRCEEGTATLPCPQSYADDCNYPGTGGTDRTCLTVQECYSDYTKCDCHPKP